jgi:hypothetical protein
MFFLENFIGLSRHFTSRNNLTTEGIFMENDTL